ncbi:MAG: hypothetical protein LBC23_05055 [Coriobacteriales bacterium]|jgi:hypothetical protein|nr:hypothetical protein [Coriobacteriales bacterium]
MGQADKPRFSHITVGGVQTNSTSQPEAEEVITIGAVDVESPSVRAADAPAATDAEPQVAAELQPEQVLDDANLNIPRPTAQKVVFAACFVGLIVIIAYLVWHWVIQG